MYKRQTLYNEASEAYSDGEYATALKLLNKAIVKDGSYPEFYQLKAYIQIELKDKPSAVVATCTEGLKLDPDNVKMIEMRGTSNYFDFKYDQALADYRRMIELEQSDARYFNNYFKLLNELRYDEELMKKSELFEMAMDNGYISEEERFVSDSYFYPSLAFGRQGHTDKAVELLTNAIRISPASSMYYNNRGLHYTELEEDEKALRDLSKAIELEPDNAEYYINRNVVYFRMNDHLSGRNDLLKALSLGTTDAGVYADLAMSYLISNDNAKAAEMYEAYFLVVKNNSMALGNYAYTQIELGNLDRAKTYFKKAQEISPGEIDFYLGLMVIAQIENDRDSLEKMRSEFRKYFPEYSFGPNLLQALENEGYSYSEEFKQHWKEITN